MPQLFSKGAGTLARLAFYGALPGALAVWVVGYELYTSSYVDRVGVASAQPVAFSHEHHAGQLGVDCRYCHVYAETSSFAGVPSSRTCMTCHSQIWTDAAALEPVRESFRSGRPIPWTRVTRLPDHVYFDHSVHVSRGVACADCHGRVEEMPLTRKAVAFRMRDCLACHRDEKRVAAAEAGRGALARYVAALPAGHPRRSADELTRLVTERGVRRLSDCSTCHR
jgi:hypothetical protein